MQRLKITLKAARINAGLTQKQVADALNTTTQTVVSWEKEPYKIKMEIALKLFDLYNVSSDDLIFLPDESNLI